jgi:hypothetical protein
MKDFSKISNNKLLSMYVIEMVEISNNRAIKDQSMFLEMKKTILSRMKKQHRSSVFLPGRGKISVI